MGINIDLNSINVKELDFSTGKGVLHIEGTTNLNYNQVISIADIDLETTKGEGYLQVVEEGLINSNSKVN